MTAEETLLLFLENKSISQFFRRTANVLWQYQNLCKIYCKELLTNFVLLHKYLFSRNGSLPNVFQFPNIGNKFCLKILIFHRNEETLSRFFHAFSRLTSC